MIENNYMLKNRLYGDMAEAATDIRYLLERGYKRDSSIRFAADHYGLEKNNRYILARTVFSPDSSKARKKKKLHCKELKGKILLVDGYNVIITLESMLGGERIWIADDSFLRDIQGVFNKHSNDKLTFQAVEKMLSFLLSSEVKKADILLDTQMKHSGELAALIRKRMQELSIKGGARTSKHVDYDLKNCQPSYVVATADGIIIDSVKNVIDLPACIYRKWNEEFKELI